MNWKAARTSALLCLLFTVVYGLTNHLAALRGNVGSFFYPWERRIPFVAWTIIPYMSIDLFFIAAPFLCFDDRERRTLTRRVAAAILIAGLFFLLIPLRFSFERPSVDGWLGAAFNNFRLLDRPFNQFPSLHITLCLILADLYIRRTRGVIRVLVVIWFTLIGLSAVLTYQHHMVDVAGGLALAVVCFHFIGDVSFSQPSTGNPRVGFYYLAGSILLAGGCFAARPWTWLLLWPAASLALNAAAYFGLGPGIFRKRAGRLPFTAWVLFWPVLLGQKISVRHYSRGCSPWNQLTGRVWIGRVLSDAEAHRAIAAGVIAVLDLTGESSEARPFLNVEYHATPILDLTAPTPEQVDEAVEWIGNEAENGVVYVHCKIGYSRTAAIAGAYLMWSGRAVSVEEAMAMLRQARPMIVIRSEAAAALRDYESRLPAPIHAAIR